MPETGHDVAWEDAVKTLIAAARENNVEVVYVRKHGNMRKEEPDEFYSQFIRWRFTDK